MDVTVATKEFRDAVAWAARWVPSKPQSPTWAGLRLVGDDGELTVAAFDGDTAGSARVTAAVRSGGRVAASGRLLAALVATLPARATTTVVHASKSMLTLTAGTVVVTLPLMPATDQLPDPPEPVGTIDAQELADAVKRVAPVAAKEKFSGDFTQIRLGFEDDLFEVMAMDGRRAAWARGPASVSRPGTGVTINARTLSEAVATFDSPEITVGADQHRASFSGEQRTLIVRQWATPYRENIVRTALGWDPDTCAVVPTGLLSEALKRAVVTRTDSEPTALTWSTDSLAVAARGASDATAADTLPIKYDGPTARILVNPVLLGEALACAGGADTAIAFEPTNAKRPLRITDPGDDNYLHILVPIRPM